MRLLSDGPRARFAVGKIDSNGAFYDYGAKYRGENSPSVSSSFVDAVAAEKIINYSRELSLYIGLKYLSRIDFFVTKDGDVYFNEINVFPGMTKTSLYPALTESMGFGRGEFIMRLIRAVRDNDRGV